VADGAGVLRAYGHLLRGQVRSQASYRASFAIEVLSNVSSTVFDLLTVLVLFRVTGVLGGFPLRDVVLIIGLSSAAFAAADLVLGNIRKIGHYVRTGLLDAVLVRPLAVLPQVVLADMPLRKLSRALFGLAVWLAALAIADIEWTPARLVLAVTAPLAGVLFFSSIFVATASVAFWWIDSVEVSHAFTYGGKDFTAYPITVYGGWFRRVFAYGLGFAFVAYYPALALLGRPDPLGLPAWVGWVSPAVALVAAAAAALAWRAGVRHYRSTGS
jgi:ABC-2 type transport system permease protein